MKTTSIVLSLLFIVLTGCTVSNQSKIDSLPSESIDTTSAATTVTKRMKEIKEILIGDWIEDSIEFKLYNDSFFFMNN